MSLSHEYRRILNSLEGELEVKKSRFITRAVYIDSREPALEFLAQCKQLYPDARHHCWAYCVGAPQNPVQLAMSDDGEPSGTAGKPILNAIVSKGFGNICVVVIRYFGGIKLGAGGLIRAYGGAAAKALDEAEWEPVVPKVRFTLNCDFAQEQRVRHWLKVNRGDLIGVRYTNRVELVIALEVSLESALLAFTQAEMIDVRSN